MIALYFYQPIAHNDGAGSMPNDAGFMQSGEFYGPG